MSDLDRVVKMAQRLVKEREEVANLDASLKEAKKALLRTEREDIPELMREIGLDEVKLSDGSVLSIEEKIDARITDATRDAALSYLRQNGYGGLIKTEVLARFGKGQRDEAMALADELSERVGDIRLKEEVHYQTLKAWVKERVEAGEQIPFDTFNVYPYSMAKYTPPKN